jgi:hypothetical protein
MPVGATIVFSPKTVLHVPATSSKALLSVGVIGAGSRDIPLRMDKVTWEFDLLGALSNAERVKLSELTNGVRTSITCWMVSLTDEVLEGRLSTIICTSTSNTTHNEIR